MNNTVPAILHPRQLTRCAYQCGDVHIMAARVHHRHFKAIDPDLFHRGRIGKAGALLHRQTIHIRAHKDDGAITVFQHADDTGAADFLGHDHAGHGAQFLRHTLGGLKFTKR